jgi:hypothetical protein
MQIRWMQTSDANIVGTEMSDADIDRKCVLNHELVTISHFP